MSAGVLELPRRPKAGDRCPTCWDTLSGTLIPHCGPATTSNPKNTLDDALNAGQSRGCKWLRCNECGHYGVPGESWVRQPKEKTA